MPNIKRTVKDRCIVSHLRHKCGSAIFDRDIILQRVYDLNESSMDAIFDEMKVDEMTFTEDVVEVRIVINNMAS